MLLDIKPLHIDGLTCREDIFFSVAVTYGKEYPLAFCEAFNFGYYSDDTGQTCMGSRISTCNENMQELLEQYCGLSIITIKADTVEEVINKIRDQQQLGYPTAISVNTFWCPWNRHYQKEIFGHTTLAVDIDENNNITCIDPLGGSGHFFLPFSDFQNGFAYYSTFHFKNNDNKIDYKSIYQTSVDKIIKSNFLENMESFIKDFKMNFNFVEEFKNGRSDIWGALVYRNLTYISGSRYLYSQFIHCINEALKSKKLENIENALLNVCSKWKVVISWLLKGHYAGYSQTLHNKALGTLEDIMKEEKNILNMLKEALQGDASAEEQNEGLVLIDWSTIGKQCKFTFVELDKHFNNIAFYSEVSNDCSADFTGTGHFFLSEGAPGSQILFYEDLQFKFPDTQDDKADNISCNGQEIAVPPGEYRFILFLGASEWGNFSQCARLNYCDDQQDNLLINFSDWAVTESLYDERIVWSGKVYNKYENSLYPAPYNIFALVRAVPASKKLKSITLPDCSNMHLFAVTLCK